MMTEEFLVTLSQLKLEYSITIFGTVFPINPLQLCIDSFAIITTVVDMFSFIEVFKVTLADVVLLMMAVTYYMVSLTYVMTHYIHGYRPKDIYKMIQEVDLSMNATLLKEKDLTLTAITGLFCLLVVFICTQFCVLGTRDLIDLLTIPVSFEILSVVVMKHLIIKRLRHIRTAEDFLERTEDVILYTRQLLDLNEKLNNTYGWLLTTFISSCIQTSLNIIFFYWVIYGVGKEIDWTMKEYYPIIAIQSISYVAICIVLNIFSSMTAEEVKQYLLQ